MEQRTWYALHVRPRTEKKVNDFLAALRVFHYLPLVRKETRVQRRKVVRFLPVFPGYVFTRLSQEELSRVFGTRNIVQMISVVQPRRMIHQLRQVEHALRLLGDLRVAEHFAEGEYVKVVSGPLRGLEGRVRHAGDSASIVLSVDILGQAIEASVDLRDVKHLEK